MPLETLEEEVTEAQSYFSDPPKNESNTCDWVILPLLWAAGYARRDVESRIADSTGQFPDYTLLPNDASACWYLEAKAWNASLEDVHAKQALNYANHNGKRFVGLTNGQVWRLYDNAIQGLLADKLVTYASLRDTAQIMDFLTTLSKTEVLSGSLERLATEVSERKKQAALELQEKQKREEEAQRRHKRQRELQVLLHSVLPDQLKDPNSELILLLTLSLNETEEFLDLTPETLSLWFDELLSQPPAQPANPSPSQTVRPSFSVQQGERTLTLKALQGLTVDGKSSKPVALHTPDGKQIPLRSWVGLAEEAVRWFLQQSQPLKIPFESSHHTLWFLNDTPIHKKSNRRQDFKSITVNGKTIYMDTDRSGKMFLQEIYALCLAMQVAPEDFRVTLVG